MLSKNEERLLEAAAEGDLAMVKRLIEKGVNINCQDDIGYTPLHQAVYSDHAEIVKCFLDHGADQFISKDAEGRSVELPFSLAIHQATNSESGWLDVARLLVRNGAKINTPNETGFFPLNRAIREGKSELIRILIEHGADVAIVDFTKMTPLRVACYEATWCQPEDVELLFKSGATADDSMFKMLIASASRKSECNQRDAIIRVLIENQKKKQPETRDGITFVRFKCPQCKRSMKARETACGRRLKCPKCYAYVTVPTAT